MEKENILHRYTSSSCVVHLKTIKLCRTLLGISLVQGHVGSSLINTCEVWTGVSYRSLGPGASCTGILRPERSRAPEPAARSQCPGCAPRSRAYKGQSPAGPSVSPPAGRQRPECVRALPRPELHRGDLSRGQRSAHVFIHASMSNLISRDLWTFHAYAINCRPRKAVISYVLTKYTLHAQLVERYLILVCSSHKAII